VSLAKIVPVSWMAPRRLRRFLVHQSDVLRPVTTITASVAWNLIRSRQLSDQTY
jgi:hypothetical protein